MRVEEKLVLRGRKIIVVRRQRIVGVALPSGTWGAVVLRALVCLSAILCFIFLTKNPRYFMLQWLCDCIKIHIHKYLLWLWCCCCYCAKLCHLHFPLCKNNRRKTLANSFRRIPLITSLPLFLSSDDVYTYIELCVYLSVLPHFDNSSQPNDQTNTSRLLQILRFTLNCYKNHINAQYTQQQYKFSRKF